MPSITVFPDPNPEITSVDGQVRRSEVAAEAWSTLRNGAGTTALPSTASVHYVRFVAGATSNWVLLARSIFLFDTSSIPDDATIESATFSLKGEEKADPGGNTPNMVVVNSTPASNTDLVAADYGQVGTTEYSARKAYADLTADNSFTDFTLNATGLANISLLGITKLGLRNGQYDIDNVAPTFGANQDTFWGSSFADTAGTASDPKLVVNYTGGVVVSSISTLLLMGVG